MSERILLVVEEAFVARGPGVLLLPRLTADQVPSGSFPVVVRHPSGGEREVKATSERAHGRGPLPPFAMVRLPTMTPADVPTGTALILRSPTENETP